MPHCVLSRFLMKLSLISAIRLVKQKKLSASACSESSRPIKRIMKISSRQFTKKQHYYHSQNPTTIKDTQRDRKKRTTNVINPVLLPTTERGNLINVNTPSWLAKWIFASQTNLHTSFLNLLLPCPLRPPFLPMMINIKIQRPSQDMTILSLLNTWPYQRTLFAIANWSTVYSNPTSTSSP